MVQPRRARVVDRLQARQRGPRDAGLFRMGRSAPLRGRTHVDLRRGILPQHAAGFVHHDSSQGEDFTAGCQIDL